MAAGVCNLTGSEIGLAISGVAGPAGGSQAKPVGTVWVCAEVNGSARVALRVLPGDREEIRQRAAQMALDMVRHQTKE
jgi:PncC family amidohydrolase